MKKFISVFIVALSLFVLVGCQEAANLQKDVTDSYENLSEGVTETKENIEGAVQTAQDTVEGVKSTIDNVTETAGKVKEATDSVSDLME
jgi:methyl-accepting chemotaxis protein